VTDGIAAMKDKAAQRRHIPPTRNPVSVESSEAPKTSESVVIDGQEPITDKTPPAAPEPTAPSPPQHASKRPLRVTKVPEETLPVELGDLYRSTIYFNEAEDTFLEDVRGAARRSKPKVDASRSAVVRLAVRRLLADLSASQVVDELRHQEPRTEMTRGRKRL
jgi:hypothetical protein